MRTLIAYFSRKGYVRRVARNEAEVRAADLFEITTPERTRGIPGFWWCGRFGMHRWDMPIDPITADVEAYDTVVVCTPIWVFTMAAPVRAFLRACSGRAKNVEYIFVHFSFPMRYDRTAADMDRLLGVNHSRYTSVACLWGRVLRQRMFERGEQTASC